MVGKVDVALSPSLAVLGEEDVDGGEAVRARVEAEGVERPLGRQLQLQPQRLRALAPGHLNTLHCLFTVLGKGEMVPIGGGRCGSRQGGVGRR